MSVPGIKGLIVHFISSLRSEARFLLHCAKNNPADLENLRALLRDDFDWNYLFQTAFYNGMIPLLYTNAGSLDGIDPEFNGRLRMELGKISARNLFFSKELTRILKLFESSGISAIPYKGPALAEKLYGNLALRHFVDLDILVRKSDVLKAKELLMANGYRPKKELLHLTPSQEKAFLGFQYSYDFDHETAGHQLEIHWEVVPRTFSLNLNYDRIWQCAQPASYNGCKVLFLSPEDLILILCISGAKHVWDRLSRICDIAETLRMQSKINWEQVESDARNAGALRILYLGLTLAADLLEAPIEPRLKMKAQADDAIPALVQEIVSSIFSSDRAQSGFTKKEDQFQPMHVKMRERIMDKFRYCVLVASTPSVGEWAVASLPAALYFVYWIIRPFRLLWKGLTRLFPVSNMVSGRRSN